MGFLEAHPALAWNVIRVLASRLPVAGGVPGVPPAQLPRLTTEQIAHHIGARRESVSRSLSRLSAAGAVRRDGHARCSSPTDPNCALSAATRITDR